MDPWKLCFVLLLPLSAYSHSKESRDPLLKIISEQPDLTPICSNETHEITMIMCKNSTEMSRGKECYLLYRHPRGFKHNCDSRFTLKTINQTVFLHLDNLTPADSGSFTCECTLYDGIYTLQLNITVQENKDPTSSTEMSYKRKTFLYTIIGLTVLLIISISGLILGVICRRIFHHRRQEVPITIHPQPEEDIEPYDVFIQKENVLYLTKVHSSTA
ncbi:uncharacterized protein LOC133425088 [Cololabis saira]|uniref:uncharacterized protein LOC133425088 n=1 Tax=Cololabis saira TaxID=129043 RepID=UPI002AD23B57|nr:uncharacterized protein LOC133425088 [Cololabis saira]